MAQTKYGQYVKTIPAFKDYGHGYYRQGTEMDSNFLGHDLNLKYGTFYNTGVIEPFRQTQVCDYDQFVIFMGTRPYDPGYLGAQVDFCIGDEKDKYRITTSTCVSIPKGLPYGPINIASLESRFIMMEVAATRELKSKPVLQDKPEGPYAAWMFSKHFFKLHELGFVKNGPYHYGPLNADTHDGSIASLDDKEYTGMNMSYEFVNKAPYRFGPMPDAPHVHDYTEFLIHIGSDCNDLNEYPAEEEYCLGEEKETHLITRPTIIVLPKGVPHCPQRVIKQTKPWIFMIIRPWEGAVNLATATRFLK